MHTSVFPLWQYTQRGYMPCTNLSARSCPKRRTPTSVQRLSSRWKSESSANTSNVPGPSLQVPPRCLNLLGLVTMFKSRRSDLEIDIPGVVVQVRTSSLIDGVQQHLSCHSYVARHCCQDGHHQLWRLSCRGFELVFYHFFMLVVP